MTIKCDYPECTNVSTTFYAWMKKFACDRHCPHDVVWPEPPRFVLPEFPKPRRSASDKFGKNYFKKKNTAQ